MFLKILFIFIHFLLIESQEESKENHFSQSLYQKPVFPEDIAVVEGDGGPLRIQVEDDVQVLNSENFDLVVLSKPLILVEFYTDWCHHCRQLAPEYSSAAKTLKDEGIPLAKVNAQNEAVLAKRFGVSSFPTIFWFQNGTQQQYEGSRTALAIIEFMRRRNDENWKPEPETVITLTKDNFDAVVEKEDLILVQFYAPGCGHCQRLAPEYERAAKRLSQLEKAIPLAKVDATVEKRISEKFKITGFPALRVFRRGKPFEYSGGRDETQIVHYMKAQRVSPSTQFESSKQLNRHLIGSHWPIIVGLFESRKCFEVFIEVAFVERERNFRFFHSFDPKVISSMKENSDSLLLFESQYFSSEFEPKIHRLPMDSSITCEEISYFIGNNSLPLVGLRTPSSQWLFQKLPLVVVYYDVDLSFEHQKQTQITRRQVLEVANRYKRRITFCVSREEDYLEELKNLKLEDSGEDVNVGFFESPTVRYAMSPEEDFDARVLNSFVEDVLNGRVKRVLKSQTAPARNEGPVVTVVGQTFDSLVMKSEKTVLIEFYAEWCGHCQKLEPIYRQLAQRFAKNSDLLVAKIDGTQNDFPEMFEVNGFPTIYLLRKEEKTNPLLYSGDRSLSDLIRFLETVSNKKDEL